MGVCVCVTIFVCHKLFNEHFRKKIPGDFPDGSEGKSICLQCGRPGFNPWVGKISCRRKWQPTPVFLPGKSHWRWNLVGYSPWGRKESDTTEQLHFQKKNTYSKIYWGIVFIILLQVVFQWVLKHITRVNIAIKMVNYRGNWEYQSHWS